MGAARIEDMATIDQQILDAQAIAYQGASTVPYKGTKNIQPGQQTAATALIPSNTNQPTIQTPGIFQYQPGNAPPPPKSSLSNRRGPLEEEPQTPTQNQLINQSGRALKSIMDVFGRANRRVGGVPTPGGIWVPFWILIFFYLVLIPGNGHTRLYWFWLTIIGSAVLSGTINGTRSDAGAGTATVPPAQNPLPPGILPTTGISIPYTGVTNYMFSLNGSSGL